MMWGRTERPCGVRPVCISRAIAPPMSPASLSWPSAVREAALVLLAVLAAPAPAQPVVVRVDGGARGRAEDVAVGADSVVGSLRPEWVVVRGRGLGADAVARLRGPGITSEVVDPSRLRRRPPDALKVRATFGTEASRWTVEVTSGGRTSRPHPFWVVPPRPVVQHAEVLDGGVRRGAYTVRLVGPAFSDASEVLVGGRAVPTEPVRSSPYPEALTVGLRARVPAEAFEGGQARLRVRTAGAAGGGVSDPVAVGLPSVPWSARPEVWLALVAGLVGLGLVGYRAGVRRARERAERVRLEAEVAARTAELEEQAGALDAALATQAAQADALRDAAERRTRTLAGVTHDLRTPLAVVLVALDGVLARGRVSDDDRAEVEAARRAVDQLSRLSASLGEAARHEAGQVTLTPAPLDVAALARDVVAEQAVLLDRLGVSAGVEAEGAAWALADGGAVRRVLANLLDNAGRYTPEGGRVTVAVGPVGDGEELPVEITVRDTGPGFDPAFVLRAFEPYERGDEERAPGAPAREGLGLGLTVVRDLVERMGGTVRAEPGPGGTVAVTLPAAPPCDVTVGDPVADSHGRAGGAESRGTEGLTSADGPQRARVLVVEDDPELRDVLARTLADEFDVEAVADGQVALDSARRARPTVVVSDVLMPGLGGLGLVRAFRASAWGDDVPVVLVTALDAPAQIVEGFAAGADDYVTKPFSRAVLLARVRRLVGGRLEQTAHSPRPVGPDGEPLSADDADLVERVRAAVEADLADPDFDVRALGRAVGLSRSQLTRRLKEALGTTPAKYVEAVRLDHAAGLLRSGGRLVKEAAAAVGYRDVRTFSRRFQERFGAVPSEWE